MLRRTEDRNGSFVTHMPLLRSCCGEIPMLVCKQCEHTNLQVNDFKPDVMAADLSVVKPH